jgi:ubiquinone/menaquinone biosynthesis C-methylase UbiE
MRRHWNEVAGPRWVRLGGIQEARNVEVATLLLEAAAAKPGERVLDIGCGTGATLLPLAGAVGPQGRVTGVDIAEPMLDQARRRTTERGLGNVELLLADAQTHDFAPASFDLVVSRFGVMFFADPFAAFRNLHGALRDGGRLAMGVWAPIADNTHWKLAYDIVVRRLGQPAAVAPHAPGPLAFSDPDYFRRILAEAGFADISIVPREFHVRGESAAGMAEHATMMGPSGRLLDEKQADAPTRAAAAAEIAEAFAAYADSTGEVRLPGTVWLAAALKKS